MQWLTIDQLARELGMSRRTIQNRLCNGASMPPSYKIGRSRLFQRDEVDAWIERSRTETTTSNHTEELQS